MWNKDFEWFFKDKVLLPQIKFLINIILEKEQEIKPNNNKTTKLKPKSQRRQKRKKQHPSRISKSCHRI